MRNRTRISVIAMMFVAGCASGVHQIGPPRTLPIGTTVSAVYDANTCTAQITTSGNVTIEKMAVWYPKGVEVDSQKPFVIRPKAEFIRFNMIHLDPYTQEQSWVFLSKNTYEEQPSLLSEGIGLSQDGSNFLVDMNPLIKSGCTKNPTPPKGVRTRDPII